MNELLYNIASYLSKFTIMHTLMPKNLERYFVCKCFYRENFFIKEFGKHITYINDDQLLEDYKDLINSLDLKESVKAILDKIHIEAARRRELGPEIIERKKLITIKYKRLHPEVFRLQRKFFQPAFLKIVEKSQEKDVTEDKLIGLMNVHKSKESRIYSFPMFTAEFCEKFLGEIENFEKSDIPKTRPNSMNRYGVSLTELGFDEEFFDTLRITYLRPICSILFPDWGGDCLDSQKAFIVKYKISEDTELNYHYDNAEVTLNISLNTNFIGGSLYFGEMRNQVAPEEYIEIKQQPMFGLLHRGQQRHGAEPIKSGERYNLIIWMRSSKIRNAECPMCNKSPQLVETMGYGDGFKMNDV